MKEFQQGNGLTTDGVVGPMTLAALGATLDAPTAPAFTHRVRLRFRSLSLTDTAFDTLQSSTQQVHAPNGIKIEFGSGLSLGLSDE